MAKRFGAVLCARVFCEADSLTYLLHSEFQRMRVLKDLAQAEVRLRAALLRCHTIPSHRRRRVLPHLTRVWAAGESSEPPHMAIP